MSICIRHRIAPGAAFAGVVWMEADETVEDCMPLCAITTIITAIDQFEETSSAIFHVVLSYWVSVNKYSCN